MSRTDLKEFIAKQTRGITRERQDLVEALLQASRRMGTRSVLFHAAIAERLGLNPSDHKCADLICNETGPITAGRLAELTGLSTGAITGVVDRLERAGFVSRVADADDRRRVVIQACGERAPDMRHLLLPLVAQMVHVCESYSDEQLSLIMGFMERCSAVAEAQIQRLQTSSPAEPGSNPEKSANLRAKSARPKLPTRDC